MRALTVRQPWASLIISGEKDIENRTWKIEPQRIWIHAGKGVDEWQGHKRTDLPAGRIIGSVEVVACVRNATSRWAESDNWHWILRDPKTISKTWETRGALGLWTPKMKGNGFALAL